MTFGQVAVAFPHVNIHAERRISCPRLPVNDKIRSLVHSSTTSLPKRMNRTTHIQPTLAIGFAVRGIGTCFHGGMKRFLHWASAQAGVVATQ